MKAVLVEGVAGSGKTTDIAEHVRDRWLPGATLLLTFSRTGRSVLQHYLAQCGINNASVHTIEGFAIQILKELGDTRFLLSRERIEKELLPELYHYVSDQMVAYAKAVDEEISLPSPSPRLMRELMSDMDFYRASCAFEYEDDAVLEDILAGKLNHDWRLVRRLLGAYDTYRESWHPALSEQDDQLFETSAETPYKGEQGFRSLDEAVYDLLTYVEDTPILREKGSHYSQLFIDEFHDTTPLQLRFLLQLVHEGTRYVRAVGDRFQNIFAWRGTNTDVVFEQFTQRLHAEKRYLNHSYRYGQKLADLATTIIHRPIESKATDSIANSEPSDTHESKADKIEIPRHTSISTITANELAKIHRETVVIAQDLPDLIHAVFTFFSHGKQKIAFPIHHSLGVSLLNILCVLRYDYLLDKENKLVKNIAFDLAQLLQLPQCLLSYQAKQEMLKNPTLESIRMYFDMHLQHTDFPAYQQDLREALIHWMNAPNQEHTPVYSIMCEFQKLARLWSIHSHRIHDRMALASWEALKEDARLHAYPLEQWPKRVNQFYRRWNDREGLRFATVSQAKGREYDDVLVYNANEQGFLSTYTDEVSRHQFYVAITRAKKSLTLYQPVTPLSSIPTDSPRTVTADPSVGTQKRLALEELRKIKNTLRASII